MEKFRPISQHAETFNLISISSTKNFNVNKNFFIMPNIKFS